MPFLPGWKGWVGVCNPSLAAADSFPLTLDCKSATKESCGCLCVCVCHREREREKKATFTTLVFNWGADVGVVFMTAPSSYPEMNESLYWFFVRMKSWGLYFKWLRNPWYTMVRCLEFWVCCNLYNRILWNPSQCDTQPLDIPTSYSYQISQ